MSHELPKTYDPSAIEVRWAEYWVAEKLFSVQTPEPGSPQAAKPIFTMLLPLDSSQAQAAERVFR